jgi:hypothetical protein
MLVFCERFGWRNAGVCHADIDPAKLSVNGVGKLAHAFVVRNLKGRGVNFYPLQSARLFCDKVQVLGVPSADGEVRAFRGASQRRGATNSFAGCGNNGDTISESGFHKVSINFNSIRLLDRRGLQPS